LIYKSPALIDGSQLPNSKTASKKKTASTPGEGERLGEDLVAKTVTPPPRSSSV
jgi:hypothetical protein